MLYPPVFCRGMMTTEFGIFLLEERWNLIIDIEIRDQQLLDCLEVALPGNIMGVSLTKMTIPLKRAVAAMLLHANMEFSVAIMKTEPYHEICRQVQVWHLFQTIRNNFQEEALSAKQISTQALYCLSNWKSKYVQQYQHNNQLRDTAHLTWKYSQVQYSYLRDSCSASRIGTFY
jgi:hypothetical protein